ncbi:MAG: Hsp70 family protein [Candidatus Aquicultorales bacterium]
MANSWIGIDLGTYNSSAAIRTEQGTVELVRRRGGSASLPIASEEQTKEFPSFISFDADGTVVDVGVSSKERASLDPEHVVWGIKRLLGKTYSELKEAGELDRFPYRIRPDRSNGQCIVVVEDKSYTPVELCSEILKKIKADAEAQAGRAIDSVVVSVPAYFDPVRVTPIVEATRLAGFLHPRTIPEPVAAALAYNLEIGVRPTKVLVFDLGAGTLDVTAGCLYRDPDIPGEFRFQVSKNTGNPRLGGIDMDDRLVEALREKCGLPNLGPSGKALLRRAAETAKIRLSCEPRIEQRLHLGGTDYCCSLDRLDLKSALEGIGPERNLLDECRRQLMSAIHEAGWVPEEIELLIIIGGPTRLSCLHDVFKVAFHSNPAVLQQLDRFYSADEVVDRMTAVSIGAAMSVDRPADDRVPYGHGIEVIEYGDQEITYKPCILIPRDSPYPYRSTQYRLSWFNHSGLFEFKIIQQVPESDATGSDHKYKFVGIQRFAVKNPRSAAVIVQMGYSENKELEVSIRNALSTESVTYVGFNQFNSIGMDYPMTVAKPPEISKSNVKKAPPSSEACEAFAKWAQTVVSFLHRKNDGHAVPQMLVSQMLDEIKGLLGGQDIASNYEALYTRINSLLWNANSRGLLSQSEYSELENLLTEHEGSLFRVEVE